jgi:hypothetical protein
LLVEDRDAPLPSEEGRGKRKALPSEESEERGRLCLSEEGKGKRKALPSEKSSAF